MRRRVTTVYQLKIVLEGIRPPIWRRVLVPADLRLSHLHQVLQIVMGWTDSHLHAFVIGGMHYSMPYEELDDDLDMEDERRVRLSSRVPEVQTRFGYQYDFGDDWQLKSPRHPDHQEMKQWAGERFEPETFALEEINQRLRRLRV